MAEVVGHWTNLSEAQKLTQSVLLSGVVDEVIESGQLLPILPTKQLNGKSLLYNRENSWTASDGAAFYNPHQVVPWTADVDYATQIEKSLKIVSRGDILDKFIRQTYANVNDYRAVVIRELAKRVARFVEYMILYGDETNGSSSQFDGLHRLVQESQGTPASTEGSVNIDGGETALALNDLRLLLDACKVEQSGRNNVFILAPRPVIRRLSSAYQEAGFVRASVTVSVGSLDINGVGVGGRIMAFDGIPILASDFLVAEEANTGTGASGNARASYSTGTRMYSIFAVRVGAIEDGGLEMLFGGTGIGQGEFRPFERESFGQLENYLAEGERLFGFLSPALGSTLSLGRIFDITDAAPTP